MQCLNYCFPGDLVNADINATTRPWTKRPPSGFKLNKLLIRTILFVIAHAVANEYVLNIAKKYLCLIIISM
jgi:hypothetical protein